MHDLELLCALGATAPRSEMIGAVTLQEVTDIALASLGARHGAADACTKKLQALLGALPPGPNAAVLADPYAAVWMGPDQWMIGASHAEHEELASGLKARFGDSASITEQNDAWVTIDLSGDNVVDLLERLCPAPVRRMETGGARRTQIHQMGCFVICGAPGQFFRVLGPRSSAGSLWHALVQAAHAVA